MLTRLRNRQKGFTLIELLIVVAIIGIIAALLIPNFLDSLQKAKQKRTIGDMRNVGTAWMAWLTDVSQASAAGRQAGNTYNLSNLTEYDEDDLAVDLSPRYIQKLPEGDGWRGNYNYYRNDDITEDEIMAITSPGKGAVYEAVGSTVEVGSFNPTEYDQDIAWADGFFIRWPAGQGIATTAP